ncbi:MAG: calcineurin-like phosphoesterase C-terminal domain-containing protein [Bacteroidales bacterium]|nr:calcineurin-like phosphoesterase C-terminal domain-containing protein [Bacteroidales bacterium]
MMKKVLTVILGLLLACAYAWAQGIGSAKDLQAFIEACNKGEDLLQWCNADSVVVLTADIDLSKTKKLPQVTSFSGRFDGQGHSLKGWKTIRGLFSELTKSALVKSIVIDASCTLDATSKGDELFAGFIADKNFGTVRDCINYGTVNHKCAYALAPNNVGGIVGFNRFVLLGCENYGKITSDTNGAYKEEVSVNIGGIAGACGAKSNTSSVIARCVNHGQIKVVSSLYAVVVGGITGNAAKSSLKYCDNRGDVEVKILTSDDGEASGIGRVGGICGTTKWDILRCCNYASLKGEGACGIYIGGITGNPHAELVIADCQNYGAVSALGEQPSHAGGIAGNIRRPVHIRGCSNYGAIRFDGVSSRARSTAGGIVGQVYCPKDQVAGGYVRECVNHGPVYAGAGGNKYEPSNRNAIHAAGVVGYAEARDNVRSFVSECSSDGSVSCKSGRKGEIIGNSVLVKTGGSASPAVAQLAKPSADGITVSGKITTPDGSPLEGIVVSDGFSCIKTGPDGRYAFKSDMSKARFVYLSLPADAVIPTRYGVPQFFRRIPHDAPAVTADFVLEKRDVQKNYTVMMIADPQVRQYGVDGSMETWRDVVAPDAEAFRAAQQGDVYSINLGDLVYNNMFAWDDYMDIAASINCPTFNVIGNHDYDQATLFEIAQGDVYYETYVGPTHFSFDLGELHYVVMNDIMYDRPNVKAKYHYGLDDETLAWLRSDLSFVPKDKIIVACTHASLFKNPNTSPHGSHGVYFRHYQEYLDLLSSYRKVYSWFGHYHQNFYYNYANHFGKDTKHGAPNIECIRVARCTGSLRLNKKLGAMGEPQGYMVLSVSGDQLSWYYKSVGHGQEHQLRIYDPSRSVDGVVKANIWNWSEGWSQPEWSEDGGMSWTPMESTPGVDPDYYDIFLQVDNQTTKKYCAPSTNAVLFSVTPSEGCTGGMVRTTDMFGNTYSESIKW